MSNQATQLRAYRITGRVQGVFYRVWTRDTALQMGLSGRVRNLNDGSVEVEVRGSLETLDDFERRLWEGPPASRVEGVERREPSAVSPEDGFMILS